MEALFRELLGPALTTPPPTVRKRGRIPTVPAAALWAGILVGLLRGTPHQRDLWRLLACHGLWDLPRFHVCPEAVRKRLRTTPPTQMAHFFTTLTAALRERLPPLSATDLAPFATDIFAFDHTVLDPVLRKAAAYRNCAPGDAALLPGALGCVFDVRRQLWHRVEYTPTPIQDIRASLLHFTAELPVGSLVLFDLGYFSFWGFDALTDAGQHYVTRLREKVSFTVAHVFYDGPAGDPDDPQPLQVRDRLIYLGAYRSDQAAQPVRLIEITTDGQTYSYLTNVLDPTQLSAAAVSELYRRRWDIERGFDFVKTNLHLSDLWSSHTYPILLQVFAVFILAQALLACRNQVAAGAGVDVREVSMPLLVRWFPPLAAAGLDPVAEFIRVGKKAGYIRPFRGKKHRVPTVDLAAYSLLTTPPPRRNPRYRTGPLATGRAPARKSAVKPPKARTHGPYGRKLEV